MKLFDAVRTKDKKDFICGIITDEVGDCFIVDTFIYGSYKVPKDLLEPLPRPKGLLTVKSQLLSDKQLKIFRDAFKNSSSTGKVYKTPIFKD